MPAHEVFQVVAGPLLAPPAGPPIRLSDLPPVPLGPEPSPAQIACEASRQSRVCPVCTAEKMREAYFCDPCRDALPRGRFRRLWELPTRGGARAERWAQACADLRGE